MTYTDFWDLAQKNIHNTIVTGSGSFETYRENVETFKVEHPNIIEQYGLTESELLVLFMMLFMNYDEIQQCASSGNGTAFAKECVRQYDSFLKKVPVSTSSVLFRVDKYQHIDNFVKMSIYVCECYLTASTNQVVFSGFQNGIKFVINKRFAGTTKAHEVFKIFNANDEFQVNFERNTRFRVDGIDKKDKVVFLTEL